MHERGITMERAVLFQCRRKNKGIRIDKMVVKDI